MAFAMISSDQLHDGPTTITMDNQADIDSVGRLVGAKVIYI
jgi:hypothetical protein